MGEKWEIEKWNLISSHEWLWTAAGLEIRFDKCSSSRLCKILCVCVIYWDESDFFFGFSNWNNAEKKWIWIYMRASDENFGFATFSDPLVVALWSLSRKHLDRELKNQNEMEIREKAAAIDLRSEIGPHNRQTVVSAIWGHEDDTSITQICFFIWISQASSFISWSNSLAFFAFIHQSKRRHWSQFKLLVVFV